MAILVHLPSFMAGPIIAELQRVAPDVPLWRHADEAPVEAVEAIIAWSIQPGLVGAYPNLRVVCAASAGVDKIMPPDLPAHIPVTRVVDPAQQTGISHHVLAAALRHLRGLALYAEQQRRGEWRRHPGRELANCRIGVLGLGGVGATVAQLFASLGYPVTGWSRSEKQLPGVRVLTGDDGLAATLAASDVLVCALPLTAQTHGLLDRDRLAQLPAGAFLINVGRGAHVVEPDLIALIDAGHLAGAALDVFSKEPPTAEDPIWTHPRIEATPHVATDPSYELAARQCVENLRRVRDGSPLLNSVDRQRGY